MQQMKDASLHFDELGIHHHIQVSRALHWNVQHLLDTPRTCARRRGLFQQNRPIADIRTTIWPVLLQILSLVADGA